MKTLLLRHFFVAALLGSLQFSHSSSAAIKLDSNLIVNADAEASAGADASGVLSPTGWQTASNFTALTTNIGTGANCFAGGPSNGQSSATQTINISDQAAEIDAGNLHAAISGLFGGLGGDDDYMEMHVELCDAASATIATTVIGHVQAASRANLTGLTQRSAAPLVPAGTRFVKITLTAYRVSNANDYNDGYADNVSFKLVKDAITMIVPGSANPYLAGVPDGGYGLCDTAPGLSPTIVAPPQAVGIVTPGAQESFYFYAVGATSFNGGAPLGDADGSDFLAESPLNGISGCVYPLNGLIGVFLDDNAPLFSDTAPPALDFSPDNHANYTPVPGGVNYTQLSPQLRQVFFIGNGVSNTGVSQRVIAPLGATRLFLASSDGCGWYNNSGSFSVLVAKKPITVGPPAPVHGGLSDTVFNVNDGNAETNVADTVLRFSAQQTGNPAGLVVRVQTTVTPETEASWTELPNGSAGYMTFDPAARQFALNSTNYPLQNGAYFRAISSAPGYTDSVSNAVGPFNLSASVPHLGPTVLYLATNGPGANIKFRASETSPSSGTILRVQASTKLGSEVTWADLNDGNAGHMLPYSNPTKFYLDSNKYPPGDVVYFRAVASAPGHKDSLSNAIGVTHVVVGAAPAVEVLPPFPEPGSQSGTDPDHPIIVSIGNLHFGAQASSPDNKTLTSLGLIYDGSIIDRRSNGANTMTMDYLTNVPGDHVIKAFARDERGIMGYADPVYIRIAPSGGKVFKMVGSGDWSNPANWQDGDGNGGVPGADDFAIVGSSNVSIAQDITAYAVSLNGGSINGSGGGLTITGYFSVAAGQIKNLDLTIASSGTMSLVGENDVPISGSITNYGTVRVTGRGGIVAVPNGSVSSARTSATQSRQLNGFFDGFMAAIKNIGDFIFHRPSVPPPPPQPPPVNPPPIPVPRGVTASKFVNQGRLITNDGGSLITNDGGSIIGNDGASLITNDGGSLIGNDGASLITNDGGSVISNDGASLITNDGGSLIGNDGASLRVPNGSSATTSGTGTGTIAGYTQIGGETNLNGITIIGSISLEGGVLDGSGVIAGNLTNNAFVSPGHSPGAIGILGDYAQGSQGALIFENGGPGPGRFDWLHVGGHASLGGRLDVQTINGYTPDAADTFNPLAYGDVSGGFDSISSNTQFTFDSTGAVSTVDPNAPQPANGQALNISTRLNVQTGDNVSIAGFIVTGSSGSTKKVLIRGLGPSLVAAGISNPLADPFLEFHKPDSSVETNDDWQQTPNADQIPSGLALSDSHESAIVATLPPGAYTAILKGAHGETGVGLVEVYDLNSTSPGQLTNVSTRGFVQVGDNVMIGGFIVGGNEPSKILVRAIGPSLTERGVLNVLTDPILELHDVNGSVIRNDDWRNTQETAINATGLAPSFATEAAILITLPPGPYTAIVRGKNDGTGVALIEAYHLQ
jgi:hypothetical protein